MQWTVKPFVPPLPAMPGEGEAFAYVCHPHPWAEMPPPSTRFTDAAIGAFDKRSAALAVAGVVGSWAA
jgi:hypothetical protein